MRAGVTAAADPGRLLDLCELGWAPALRDRVLVAEAEPEAHADMLPAVAGALLGRGADVVAGRWPACLLTAVVGTVATAYRRGSAWGVWWHARGRRSPSGDVSAAWDRAFRAAASVFGLAEFPDLSGDEALLAHTAVPDAFLEELASALAGAVGPEPSGPVALLLGRPEAVSFLGLCRHALGLDATDAMDATDATGAARGHGATATATDTGASTAEKPALPQRFLDAMAGLRDRHDRSASPHAAALAIEPFGRGPLLTGTGGPEISAAPSDVAGRLFVFAEDGAAVPESAALAPATVWLLYPVGAPPQAAGALRVVTQGSLPLLWTGWSLVEADLTDVSWLSPPEPGAVRRVVSGKSKPALVTGPPLAGLFHGAGRPVFAGAPVLRLPAGAEAWQVEVRDREGGVLARTRVRGTEQAAVETSVLWQSVSRPLLGAYTVRVSGGSGPGLVRTVAVAEGLAIERYPDVRLLRPDGLEPAEIVFHPGAGMTAIPAALTIGTACARARVEVVAGHRREGFLLEPPRLRVGVDSGSRHADTDAVHPLELDPAVLAGGGRLVVELPGSGRPAPLELVAGGQVVQTLRPHRDGGYNLRRVLDTAAGRRDTVLRLACGDRVATVAWIRERAASQDPWLPREGGSAQG